MTRSHFFLLVVLLLAACASEPSYRYEVSYRMAESTQLLNRQNAERAVITSFDATALAMQDLEPKDRPRLIRAPQPVMPPDDIVAGVIGNVDVEIWFNEAGTVTRVEVLKSVKESLSDAVRAAVSQWQIVPPRRDGKPRVLVARQRFEFGIER